MMLKCPKASVQLNTAHTFSARHRPQTQFAGFLWFLDNKNGPQQFVAVHKPRGSLSNSTRWHLGYFAYARLRVAFLPLYKRL